MESTGQLEPRVSVLDEEFNEAATLEVRRGRWRSRHAPPCWSALTHAPWHVPCRGSVPSWLAMCI